MKLRSGTTYDPLYTGEKARLPVFDAETGIYREKHNTRSTDISKANKVARVLCDEALNTSWLKRPNARVEKMVEFMRWIRTHKKMLVNARFNRTCYRKCHSYCSEAADTSVSKRVKPKLLKSLHHECSLILDIIKNEF